MEIADLAHKREDIEYNTILETYYSIFAHYLPKANKMYSILAPFLTRISEKLTIIRMCTFWATNE